MHNQRISICVYTPEQAERLFWDLIRKGDHHQPIPREMGKEQLSQILVANGCIPEEAIALLTHNHRYIFPAYENMFVSGLQEFGFTRNGGKGVTAKLQTIMDGVVVLETEITQQCFVDSCRHMTFFTESCTFRDAAIEKASIQDFYTCIDKGFSSINAFFDLHKTIYNGQLEEEHHLNEKKLHKNGKGGFSYTSLEEKVIEWIPKLSELRLGSPAVISDFKTHSNYEDFLYLKGLRNDASQHAKLGHGIRSIQELVSAINKYRSGIAGLLYVLHEALLLPMPSNLIRAFMFPEVRVNPDYRD